MYIDTERLQTRCSVREMHRFMIYLPSIPPAHIPELTEKPDIVNNLVELLRDTSSLEVKVLVKV